MDRVVRGIPLWLLREYLVELGGVPEAGIVVSGPGWRARLEQVEDYRIGSLAVGQVRIRVDGDPQAVADLARRLEPRLLRAGG